MRRNALRLLRPTRAQQGAQPHLRIPRNCRWHQVAAFHGAYNVDDGYRATTMSAVNIGEQLLPHVSRNCAPELGCWFGKPWKANYCHWGERVGLRLRLTFDMRGAQKAQPFGHPLDGRVRPQHTTRGDLARDLLQQCAEEWCARAVPLYEKRCSLRTRRPLLAVHPCAKWS